MLSQASPERDNWKGISYQSKIDYWKTFEKNYPAIVLNMLDIEEKDVLPAYIS